MAKDSAARISCLITCMQFCIIYNIVIIIVSTCTWGVLQGSVLSDFYYLLWNLFIFSVVMEVKA